ncbi:VOC family protein [Fictibacillus iocasae]|uniref:VOC family protein n=1 Tax=Fictibacillus iocasae TaxID=2715437 RepID=A0ABW2NW36_9BACL
MATPILAEIGTVFMPVRDIEKARDWYCSLLGIEPDGEVLFGHIYVISMTNSTNLVLDSKIYSPEAIVKTPMFHLNTKDIKAAYSFIKEKKIELTTEIQHGHYFNFKDPDGNMLMICKC